MYKNNLDPVAKKKQLRINCGSFAIIIAIFTFIGAALIPVINKMPFSDKNVIISIAISVALGAIFLIFGILFLKKDSRAIAIVLMILFGIYVIDRIYMIVGGQGASVIFWLILGVLEMFYIYQYLRIKDQEVIDSLQTPPPATALPPAETK